MEFSSGIQGICHNLVADNISVSVFGNERLIKEGKTVMHTGQIVDVPIGPTLLGCVVDALGNPIEMTRALSSLQSLVVRSPSSPPRRSINQPMLTGLKPINAMVS